MKKITINTKDALITFGIVIAIFLVIWCFYSVSNWIYANRIVEQTAIEQPYQKETTHSCLYGGYCYASEYDYFEEQNICDMKYRFNCSGRVDGIATYQKFKRIHANDKVTYAIRELDFEETGTCR